MYPKSTVSNLDQILSSLQCYMQSSRVRGDVYNLLRQVPSLQPSCGTFAHNDGTTSTLLNLGGTIPIFFRGNQYNIPVEFWIAENYPTAPPVCFVRPTAEMMVKPGHPHVTSEGFIQIPYITNWQQGCSLVELVAHLCSIFGEMPPVYRRPAHQPPPIPVSTRPNHQLSSSYGSVNSAATASPSPSRNNSENEYLFGPPTESNGTEDTAESKKNALKMEVTGQIQQKMEAKFKKIRDNIDVQFEYQLQLTQSRQDVEKGIDDMKKLKQDLTKAQSIIAKQDKELEHWLEEHEGKDEIDPDAVLVPTDALSKQLIKVVAENYAIDDALYFLDRALANDAINLASFLKEVRKLSRKQFMCQALSQKIQHLQQQQQGGGVYTS